MSLVLNMVGGGSGGISGNTAVLEIIAPVGSSVSITDGVTTKAQTSADGHPVSNRQTVAAYIFPVGSDELGTWTITASRGTETNTTTVAIPAIMDYVFYIGYHVPIGQYQEVEYIEGTGTQWINTNVSPSTGFSVEMLIAPTATMSENAMLGVNTRSIEVYMTASNKYGMFVESGGFAYDKVIDQVASLGTLVDMELTRTANGCTFTAFGMSTTAPFPTYSGDSINIFRYVGANTYIGKCRICHVRIYNGGTLVRDMWSCYRLSDSVAGMWDKVSESFFTNNGSGTFIVGGDVS